jgi:hypothetical protein
MRTLTIFCLIVVATASLFAQPADSLQKAAIRKLYWWVGEWKGEAWSSMGSSRQDTTTMVETIRKDLDGTIIIVEGLGRRKMPQMEAGEIVHHAFAVVSYNEKKQSYRWQSWRVPGGFYTETEPKVGERSLQWGMETPRGRMRYTLTVNEKGQWGEIGEFSADGLVWRQFFGMVLTKTQ